MSLYNVEQTHERRFARRLRTSQGISRKRVLLTKDSLRENSFETEVGPGVYDIHSPRVPSVAEIVKAVNVMLTKIDRDKLWINPDCGLKTRGVPETDASLRNMVEAARQVRK